jgi:hypothetical protein
MSNIIVPNPVVGVRNDCKAGQFKIGESRFLGDKLTVSLLCPPVDYVGGFYSDRLDMSEAARKKVHFWKQIWFIAAPSEDKIPQNTVFPMLIKTSSLAELAAFGLLEAGGVFHSVLCEISFKPKSNDIGATYFMLVFKGLPRKSKEDKDQIKLIESFLEDMPILYDASLPAGMIPATGLNQEQINNLLNGAIETKALVAA